MDYSVVIPHGKVGHRLERSIASLDGQVIPPRKIIVVCNNGQTRYSVQSMQLELHHTELEIVELPEAKTGNEARNRGADLADTEWIAFLDSDDWWLETYSQAVRDTIDANPMTELVYGSYKFTLPNGDTHTKRAYPIENAGTAQQYILGGGALQSSSLFLRKNLFRRVRWKDDLRRHQDWDFFVRICEQTPNVASVEAALVCVDWTDPKRNIDVAACMSVTRKWGAVVDPKDFARYIAYMAVLSIRARSVRGLMAVATVLPEAAIRFLLAFRRSAGGVSNA